MYKCEIHQTVCLDAADGRENARLKDLYLELELPFVPTVDMELAMDHMECSTVDRVVWSQALESFMVILEDIDCVSHADVYKETLSEAKDAGWKVYKLPTATTTSAPKKKKK